MEYFFPAPSTTNLKPRFTKSNAMQAKRNITFQIIWKTIDLLGRASIKEIPIICISADDMEGDLERMIGQDDLVTGPINVSQGPVYLYIHYPLLRPAKRIIRPFEPDVGFRREELCRLIGQEYLAVYESERVTMNNAAVDWDYTRNGPGDGTGRYGIHDYGLKDLFLCAVCWDPARRQFSLEVAV